MTKLFQRLRPHILFFCIPLTVGFSLLLGPPGVLIALAVLAATTPIWLQTSAAPHRNIVSNSAMTDSGRRRSSLGVGRVARFGKSALTWMMTAMTMTAVLGRRPMAAAGTT